MKLQRIADVDLAYEDRGAGPPLLLVHGFPLDHTMWAAQLGALSAAHRVIAPDLPGFGQSPLPPGRDIMTMEHHADVLAALLDALGIDAPIALCGLSMGGYIAFQFARTYRARLRALVLCDTRAAADTPEAAAGRQVTADRVLREGPAPLAESLLPRLLAPDTLHHRPHIVAAARAMMTASDPHGIAAASRGMAVRPDVTPFLRDIDCPTLVLVGEHDAISPPAEMRSLAAALPRAQFVEIAASGHLAPLEAPDAVNAAIAGFLAHLAT
jgi:pimeloyl-ACP methyl ester carboxylesterase